jgi:hypothetical protein
MMVKEVESGIQKKAVKGEGIKLPVNVCTTPSSAHDS